MGRAARRPPTIFVINAGSAPSDPPTQSLEGRKLGSLHEGSNGQFVCFGSNLGEVWAIWAVEVSI